MLYLKKPNGDKLYLLKGETYTIGRRNCNITLDDGSVSRKHATVEVNDNSVILKDCDSKYYTYLGGAKVESLVPTILNYGDEIRCGTYPAALIFNQETIATTSSCLDKEEKEKLKNIIASLGGTIENDWTSLCTHLTVNQIMVTVKVLHSLLDNKPIVNVQFWEDFLKCAKQKLPAPDVSKFIPPLQETLINQVNLDFNPQRRTVFKGKMFVFGTEKERKQMGDVIVKGGGESISWQKNPFSINKLKADNIKQYIIVQSRGTATPNSMKAVLDYYQDLGNRIIPAQEIVMAVIYCSCETDCNPSFDRAEKVFCSTQVDIPMNQIVPETESEKFSQSQDFSEISKIEMVIPSTLEDDNIFPSSQLGSQVTKTVIPATAATMANEDEMFSRRNDTTVIRNLDEISKLRKRNVTENDQTVENPFKKLKVEKQGTSSFGENCESVQEIRKQKQPIKMSVKNLSQSESLTRKRPADDSESGPSKKRNTTSKNINPFALMVKEKNVQKPVVLDNLSIKENLNEDKSVSSTNPFSCSNSSIVSINDSVVNPFKVPRSTPQIKKENVNESNVLKNPFRQEKSTEKSREEVDSKLDVAVNADRLLLENISHISSSTSAWISKSNKQPKDEVIERKILNPEVESFIQQFDETLNVVKKCISMVRPRSLTSIRNNDSTLAMTSLSNTSLVNFKKFRKVSPRRYDRSLMCVE